MFILDQDKVKKEDLTFSFLRSLAEIQGHLAHVHALAHGVRKIYFIGSVINMALMRRYLYEEIHGKNLLRPEVSYPSHHLYTLSFFNLYTPSTQLL